MSVVIVDSGLGNIASVANMIRRLGADVQVSSAVDDVLMATKIILPGVGAFDYGMQQMASLNLVEPIRLRAEKGVPMLGICLGMQLLGVGSEEGKLSGLGLLDVRMRRFSTGGEVQIRVPHVGWNRVSVVRDNPLIRSPSDDLRFYFTHSYHAEGGDGTDVIAMCRYGYDFPAVLQRENVFGVQFHPEKSHRFGMALLNNFLRFESC